MNKKDAIEYLQENGEIRQDKKVKPKWTQKEKKKIDEVVREGKIYGDPSATIS